MSVTGNPILSVNEKQLFLPPNHFATEFSVPCHVNGRHHWRKHSQHISIKPLKQTIKSQSMLSQRLGGLRSPRAWA